MGNMLKNMMKIDLTQKVRLGFYHQNYQDIVRYICLAFPILLYTWYNCHICQEFTDGSLSISEATYNSFWYQNMNKHIKSALMLMQMRTQTPCTMTIGGFIVISDYFFSSIIQTSMSYITVLFSFF